MWCVQSSFCKRALRKRSRTYRHCSNVLESDRLWGFIVRVRAERESNLLTFRNWRAHPESLAHQFHHLHANPRIELHGSRIYITWGFEMTFSCNIVERHIRQGKFPWRLYTSVLSNIFRHILPSYLVIISTSVFDRSGTFQRSRCINAMIFLL